MIQQIKVASSSKVSAVAGAISNMMREQNMIEVNTVGAGSLNQAIKAIAIARGYLVPSGIEIAVYPSFKEIMIDGNEKTAIKLRLEKVK